MVDGNRQLIFPVKEFLDPKDFFYSSAYLLFSDDRTQERKHVKEISDAFNEIHVTPKRLVVVNNVMILECAGYLTLEIDNHLTKSYTENTFKCTLAPAKFYAGEVKAVIDGRSSADYSYTFR